MLQEYDENSYSNFVRVCYRIYFYKQPFNKWAKLLIEYHQTKLYYKEAHDLAKKILLKNY